MCICFWYVQIVCFLYYVTTTGDGVGPFGLRSLSFHNRSGRVVATPGAQILPQVRQKKTQTEWQPLRHRSAAYAPYKTIAITKNKYTMPALVPSETDARSRHSWESSEAGEKASATIKPNKQTNNMSHTGGC